MGRRLFTTIRLVVSVSFFDSPSLRSYEIRARHFCNVIPMNCCIYSFRVHQVDQHALTLSLDVTGYSDPNDPYNNAAYPNSWTPPLNQSWDYTNNRIYGCVSSKYRTIYEIVLNTRLYQRESWWLVCPGAFHFP